VWLARLGANGSVSNTQVVDDGFAPKLSPDGRRLAYFQRPSSPDRPHLALKVRDLETNQTFQVSEPAAPVNFTTEPVGWATPSAVWNPSTGELYFGGRDDRGYSIHGIMPDAFKPPPLPPETRPATNRVLTFSAPREQLTDLHVSPDASRLAYLHFDSTRVDLKIRKLELKEVALSTGQDRLIRTEPWPAGRSFFYKGWTRDGRSHILLDQVRRSGPVRVFEVTGQDSPRQIATLDGAFPSTARVDARRDLLYITQALGGVQNIVSVSLTDGEVRCVTSNQQPGSWFSDFEVREDGTILYALDRRSSDIWIVRHGSGQR
jgi:Tol biopolymer transport system component